MARRITNIDTDSLQARRLAGVPRLLHGAFTVARDRVLEQLALRGHTGINISHSLVLRHMDIEGTPLSTVTRRAGVSRQAVAKVARQLEDLGYLTTNVDSTDRRAKMLKLTPNGLRLFNDSIEAYDAFDEQLARKLSPRKLEQFRKALQLINDMDASDND